MENKELHPNIVIRRHIKSTAKAGKIISDLMQAQINGEDVSGTITKRCRQENTLPTHATRFFRKWIKKEWGKTYTEFDNKMLEIAVEVSGLYEKILNNCDKKEQKAIIAIVTHLFYHYPLRGWSHD